MIAPRTLLVLSALAGTAGTAQAATFDVTATGRVEYLRFDDFPNPVKDTTVSYQASYAFTTTIPSVVISKGHVVSSGASSSTIAGVKGAEHSSDVSGGGGCTATTGSIVPGSIDNALVYPLDGSMSVELRAMDSATINMNACGGNLTANDMPIDPWNHEMGESPFDTFMVITPDDLSGDVFTKELKGGQAQCPGEVKPFTTQCSVAVTGTTTFTRSTKDPDPTPTPTATATVSPSPTASPSPSPSPAPTTVPAPVKPRVTGGLVGGRVVRTTVTCVAGCTGTLTVTLPNGKVVLGRGDVDASAGAPAKVDVRLSKPAAKKARKAGAVKVTVRVGDQQQSVKVRV